MPEDLLDDNTALGMLRMQHQRIDELLSTCLTNRQADFVRQAASVLFTELQVHFTLEKELFFPLMAKLLPERKILYGRSPEDELARAGDDNQNMVSLTDRLRGQDPTQESYHQTLLALARTFEHHCYLQEEYIFPLVEMNDPDTHNALVGLAADLKRRKDSVLASLRSAPKTHLASRQGGAEHEEALDSLQPDSDGEQETAHGT